MYYTEMGILSQNQTNAKDFEKVEEAFEDVLGKKLYDDLTEIRKLIDQ